MPLAELAELVGAELVAGPSAEPLAQPPAVADTVVTAVVTDARQCGPGSLYVARVGEHADGLDYVPQAVERGAVAVLATRPAPGLATLVVPDVQRAFARLARGVLDRSAATVVAVTGSSGKTSTKDLLAQVLSRSGPTVASAESFNGEVGVPLTVLRVQPDTRNLVVEMGARGVGHIAELTEIAPPRIAVVLNVGSAHLGEFGSPEAVARAKSELVQALDADGLAVLNADDPRVRAMAERTAGRVVLVGRGSDAAVRAADVELDDQARAAFMLHTPQGAAPVRLGLHGEHHVANALAVAAVALELGMAPQEIAAALAGARPLNRWRMEVTERPDGVRIVNDAYNANPESMRAALKALVAMVPARQGLVFDGAVDGATDGPGQARRTWAVLGEMRELGEASIREHDEIGRLAVRLNVSRLVAVGAGALPIHTGATQEGSWGQESVHVPDLDAAYALLAGELRSGDVVLLKSSRDAGLRDLGDRLVANDGRADR